MLFAGGCGALYGGLGIIAILGGGFGAIPFVLMVLVIAGIPTGFGWLIWWAAVKRGRQQSQTKPDRPSTNG